MLWETGDYPTPAGMDSSFSVLTNSRKKCEADNRRKNRVETTPR